MQQVFTAGTARRSPVALPGQVPPSYGAALLAVAGLLLGHTLAGPLVTGAFDYPLTGTLRNQLVGLEVVTLVLVVPMAVWAGLLALRTHPAAPLVGFGPAAYTAYMFVQYVLGPAWSHHTWVVLLDLAVASFGGALALWSWRLARDLPVPHPGRAVERRRGWLLLGMAAFVVLRYGGLLTGAAHRSRLAPEFADAPAFYWSIVLLDLGVVVPATVIGALALLRGHDAGRRALYAALAWFALVPASVASMALVMLARHDPAASLPTAALLTVASALFASYAVHVFRPLLRHPPLTQGEPS
jgi:hypothetical protein